ncbi:metallophosphoesterase [Gracilibacillus alcaliphilus]|uniref:metallophosphoesterase n=1 Tax=Gracilibacillus alcaliphilus TaxID=1401441 RepID=UPI001959ECB6|nr:metallophosphoesterase [Gracilibacillus alcaliphilus]MBM7678513.1 putative MPP superfamily phosphohydrolase [Gracilibacillus alcaliphilus]
MTGKKNRPFYKKAWFRVVLSLAVITAISAKIYVDTNTFKINKVPFQSDKLPEGFQLKLLQLTDIHNQVFPDENQRLLEEIQQAEADLIVITGDLIDRKTEDLTDALTLVDQITAIHDQVFYVTGNHEWESCFFGGLMNELTERGVTILHNRHVTLSYQGVEIQLVGIDDVSTERENLAEAFEGIDKNLYTILLSHAPSVTQHYPHVPADLILSGHTHGGQIRLPLIGALIAPDDGLFPKLDKGIYPLGEERYLYIDSGLGTTGAPVRLLNQSQFSLIEISHGYFHTYRQTLTPYYRVIRSPFLPCYYFD